MNFLPELIAVELLSANADITLPNATKLLLILAPSCDLNQYKNTNILLILHSRKEIYFYYFLCN